MFQLYKIFANLKWALLQFFVSLLHLLLNLVLQCINPQSSNIDIQIPQTDLHTFP